MHTLKYINAHTYTHIYMHAHTCTHTYMHAHTYTHAHTHMHNAHIYTLHTHMHTTYTQAHTTCTQSYTYKHHIYIYINTPHTHKIQTVLQPHFLHPVHNSPYLVSHLSMLSNARYHSRGWRHWRLCSPEVHCAVLVHSF